MFHDSGARITPMTGMYELSGGPFRALIESLVHCRRDNLIAIQEAFYHFNNAFHKFSLIFFRHHLCFNREVFRHVAFYDAIKLKLVQLFADWVFAYLFRNHDRNFRPCLPLAFHVYTPGLEDRPALRVPELQYVAPYGDQLGRNKKLIALKSDQLEHKVAAALEVTVTHCSIQPTNLRQGAGGYCLHASAWPLKLIDARRVGAPPRADGAGRVTTPDLPLFAAE